MIFFRKKEKEKLKSKEIKMSGNSNLLSHYIFYPEKILQESTGKSCVVCGFIFIIISL